MLFDLKQIFQIYLTFVSLFRVSKEFRSDLTWTQSIVKVFHFNQAAAE